MSSLENVVSGIRAAFPPGLFLGAVINGCRCDECTELARDLSLRAWDEIDEKIMRVHFGGLPLMTPAAFAAFLPAWMMFSLEMLDERLHEYREWTLFPHTLYCDERFDRPEE